MVDQSQYGNRDGLLNDEGLASLSSFLALPASFFEFPPLAGGIFGFLTMLRYDLD